MPYEDAFDGKDNSSELEMNDLTRLNINDEVASFFNIPVCGVRDMRFFLRLF